MITNYTIPVVSIICLTYNHSPYIRECLDGFLMQKTTFPFEVIIHDDASTDGTTKIIQEYAREYPGIIKPIFQKENQYSKNPDFNLIIYNCLKKARGEYIAICEGDDYWIDPCKLETQVEFLRENSDFGMVYTKTRYFYQQQNSYALHDFGGPFCSTSDLIRHPYCIPTATIVLKKELYIEALEKFIMGKGWLMGDFPLSLSVSILSKIKFIDKTTAIYRVLDSSACHFQKMSEEIRFQDSVLSVKKYFNRLSGDTVGDSIIKQGYVKALWKKAIIHQDFKNATVFASQVKPCSFSEKFQKLLTFNKYTFSLLIVLQRLRNSLKRYRLKCHEKK